MGDKVPDDVSEVRSGGQDIRLRLVGEPRCAQHPARGKRRNDGQLVRGDGQGDGGRSDAATFVGCGSTCADLEIVSGIEGAQIRKIQQKRGVRRGGAGCAEVFQVRVR